jgi:hypothetical protein
VKVEGKEIKVVKEYEKRRGVEKWKYEKNYSPRIYVSAILIHHQTFIF